MSKRCAGCDRIYPDNAVYCALCGKTLSPDKVVAGGGTTCCESSGSRGFAVLVALALVGLTAFAVFQASGATGEDSYTGPIASGEIELPECKANLFFDMLAPQSVKVRVGRSDRFIEVSGSPREVKVLSSFAELLVRHNGVPDGHVLAHLKKLKSGRKLTQKEYRLPREHAKALFNLLADSDVAVWVSRSGGRVNVQALPADQNTIMAVVKILNGKRLR